MLVGSVHEDLGDTLADTRTPLINLSAAVEEIDSFNDDDVLTGLGNLIIGYNDANESERTGSHPLVHGTGNAYTRHNSIVTGYSNTASGAMSTVLGGLGHEASGLSTAIISGGQSTADDGGSVILGGCETSHDPRAGGVSLHSTPPRE